MRLQTARRDYYRRRASKEGYRSRAAYKLIQIDNKYRIFDEGQSVLDIGCCPGGWLQVASERVSEKGKVAGIDLRECDIGVENVQTVEGNLADSEVLERALNFIGGPADVVLFDASPNLSGVWEVDHMVQVTLCREILDGLGLLLVEGGFLVMKVFEGEEFRSLLGQTRQLFSRVEIAKPDASRKESSEVYFVGMGFIPPPVASTR